MPQDAASACGRLTDQLPKPLLQAGGKPLIVWHLERLARAGIRDIVINHAWLGEKIEAALGDGAAYGVRIAYSAEGDALETAGGIARALPLLTALHAGRGRAVPGHQWRHLLRLRLRPRPHDRPADAGTRRLACWW